MTITPTNTPVETRISTVIGDRLCIKCSFNLSGQSVVREGVYGMAIVRCPECSTIASLQEYPLLGKWAGRFAAALAALWLFILIVGVFATSGLLFGLNNQCLETSSSRLGQEIARRHAVWYETASPAERSPIATLYGGVAPASVPAYANSWIDYTWWKKQDISTIVADLGGPTGALDPRMFMVLFWIVLVGALFGMLWTVFLLHVRRTRTPFFFLIIIALAMLFTYMSFQSPSRSMFWPAAGTAVYSMHEAQVALWPSVLGISFTMSYMSLCIGAWFGRPVIRGLARLLLPPRMLGSLAFLWIAEGKSPPRASAARR